MGELREARPVGVHHKDVATATIFSALCEEDFGAVGRPGWIGIFFPAARMGELAHMTAIGIGREDSGCGLAVVEKALPGDAASVTAGGCGGRSTLLLPGCRLAAGRQQRDQHADNKERWKTSFHRDFSFLSLAFSREEWPRLLPTLLLEADLLIEPGASPSLIQPEIEIYQRVYTPNTSVASVEIPRAKAFTSSSSPQLQGSR